MCHEAKAETLSEGFHLRHRGHLAARAPQHDHMRVVDHHAPGNTTHVRQSVAEKDLTVESLKSWIDLKEQQARIAQHCRSSLRPVLPATHFDFVRRGVMLNLDSRIKMIPADRCNRRLCNAVPAAECGQRCVRQCRPTCQEFFMD